jgi:hypothetical protein
MDKPKRLITAYEVLYNYRYMLETGYTFDEYARTVASQIERECDSHKQKKDYGIKDS